jgi:hypothetical protein
MHDENGLLPCPFCGGTNIRTSDTMYFDDDGEHPGAECIDCDALARADRWNQRAGRHHEPHFDVNETAILIGNRV